jgi:hypothetical protein
VSGEAGDEKDQRSDRSGVLSHGYPQGLNAEDAEIASFDLHSTTAWPSSSFPLRVLRVLCVDVLLALAPTDAMGHQKLNAEDAENAEIASFDLHLKFYASMS